MDNVFKDDYNIDSLEKITTLGTNLDFFITPRYKQHYTANEYESFSIEILKKILPKNGIFLDIGAHYGYYSCVAAKFCNAKIIAIEAVPENYEVLVKNLNTNNANVIKAENLVASDKNEKVQFQIVEASDSASLYGHPLTKTIKNIELLAKNTDSILNGIIPDVIKIDVEGHEIKTLDGLKEIIKKNSDLRILIEFNPKCQKFSGNDPINLLNKIDNFGFDIYIVDEDLKQLYKITDLNKWSKFIPANQYRNLLCVKKKTLLNSFGLTSNNEKSLLVTFFSHGSQFSGSERSMIELIRELKEKNIFSHVVLPNFGPLEDELKTNNILYDVVNLNWWADSNKLDFNEIILNNADSFKNLADFLPKLSLINPDLIYSNTMVSPWGAITANYLNKPHIWHIREYGELDHKFNFIAPYSEIINFIETYSDRIITNSKSVLDYVSKYLKNKKPQFAYNYIEIDKNLLKEKTESPFKIKDSLKILICGTISEGKNQIEAIKVIKELIENKVNIELLLIGDISNENYLKKIKEYVAECGIDKNVHILGFTNNPYPYFKISDVVLITSRKEAYGRTSVEAMILKKPVIATIDGGTKEIVKNNINGFTYNVGDTSGLKKILLKLQDRNLQKKVGISGFNSLKEINNKENYGYKIANIIQNTIDNYKTNNELTKIMTSVFIKNYQQSENEKNELNQQLIKIFNSKTYKIWQKFNKIKKFFK